MIHSLYSVVPLFSTLECRIEVHCQMKIYILRRINVILIYIVTNHGMVTYIEMNHDMPRYIDINQDMLRYIEGNQHALRYIETADQTQDCLQNRNLIVGHRTSHGNGVFVHRSVSQVSRGINCFVEIEVVLNIQRIFL